MSHDIVETEHKPVIHHKLQATCPFIDKSLREELQALSVEIFKSSSKWQMFRDGAKEVITHKTKKEIPGKDGAESTFEEITVPTLMNGRLQYRMTYYNGEQIKAKLLEIKAQIQKYKDDMDKAEAERIAKEKIDKEIKHEATGSAL